MLQLHKSRPFGIAALAVVGSLLLSFRSEAQESPFIRGDSDASGSVEITDSTSTLDGLFLTVGELSCSDAADSNDDGVVDVSDPIHTLLYLFADGAPPPDPGPHECGADPTPDDLGCVSFGPCPGPLPSLELDETRRVTDVIPPEGGMLSTTASNGRFYALAFPPGALEVPEEITLTPVLRIEGLPIGDEVLAGAHLAPEGLRLDSPAILTIEKLPPISAARIPVAFVARDDSRYFEIVPLAVQGDMATLQIPHFTQAVVTEIDLEETARMVLEKYYGPDGLLRQLSRVTDCNDAALKRAVDMVLEIAVMAEEFDDLVEFRVQDCVYTEGGAVDGGQCSSLGHLEWAGKESLWNRIVELFREKDNGCGASRPELEMAALDCISVAGIGYEYDFLLRAFLNDELFREKQCGISDFEVRPRQVYMAPGDTAELNAIATDGAGRELSDREAVWLNDAPGLVEVTTKDSRTIQITALKAGTTNIDALDAMSFESRLTEWGHDRSVMRRVSGHNAAAATIYIGPSVLISRDSFEDPVPVSEIKLIPPERETVRATLHDATGVMLPPTGFTWTSSAADVVGLSTDGTANYRATLMPGSPGVATITATETGTGLQGTVTVAVGGVVEVTPPELCLPVFEEAQLTATVVDLEGAAFSNIGPFDIAWFSPRSSIVSVSIEGVVIAQSEGEVEIEATYRGDAETKGVSIVFVPRFPEDSDEYEVTPVSAPASFVWEGATYTGGSVLTDDREIVNIYEEAFRVAERCGFTEPPNPADMSDNGLFTYVYEGEPYSLYAFDAEKCEEYEIQFLQSAWPQPVVINDHGYLAGHYTENETVGFLYEPENELLETLVAGCGTRVIDMNSEQEILGTAGACFRDDERTPGYNFIYAGGVYTRLPLIPGVDVDGDPTSGLAWIRPAAINDEGVVVGSYRYWDDSRGWYRVKGFIYHEDGYLLLDPPFPSTMPEQADWDFLDINNHYDILISSQPAAAEDRLEGFLSVMHICPADFEAGILPAEE